VHRLYRSGPSLLTLSVASIPANHPSPASEHTQRYMSSACIATIESATHLRDIVWRPALFGFGGRRRRPADPWRARCASPRRASNRC